jgi:hypothetical protein
MQLLQVFCIVRLPHTPDMAISIFSEEPQKNPLDGAQANRDFMDHVYGSGYL